MSSSLSFLPRRAFPFGKNEFKRHYSEFRSSQNSTDSECVGGVDRINLAQLLDQTTFDRSLLSPQGDVVTTPKNIKNDTKEAVDETIHGQGTQGGPQAETEAAKRRESKKTESKSTQKPGEQRPTSPARRKSSVKPVNEASMALSSSGQGSEHENTQSHGGRRAPPSRRKSSIKPMNDSSMSASASSDNGEAGKRRESKMSESENTQNHRGRRAPPSHRKSSISIKPVTEASMALSASEQVSEHEKTQNHGERRPPPSRRKSSIKPMNDSSMSASASSDHGHNRPRRTSSVKPMKESSISVSASSDHSHNRTRTRRTSSSKLTNNSSSHLYLSGAAATAVTSLQSITRRSASVSPKRTAGMKTMVLDLSNMDDRTSEEFSIATDNAVRLFDKRKEVKVPKRDSNGAIKSCGEDETDQDYGPCHDRVSRRRRSDEKPLPKVSSLPSLSKPIRTRTTASDGQPRPRRASSVSPKRVTSPKLREARSLEKVTRQRRTKTLSPTPDGEATRLRRKDRRGELEARREQQTHTGTIPRTRSPKPNAATREDESQKDGLHATVEEQQHDSLQSEKRRANGPGSRRHSCRHGLKIHRSQMQNSLKIHYSVPEEEEEEHDEFHGDNDCEMECQHEGDEDGGSSGSDCSEHKHHIRPQKRASLLRFPISAVSSVKRASVKAAFKLVPTSSSKNNKNKKEDSKSLSASDREKALRTSDLGGEKPTCGPELA